jgi:hypothetical protein
MYASLFILYLVSRVLTWKARLPDGIFSDQKSQIWENLGGSCNRRCLAIWYILWPFGTFCGLLVYFVAKWNMLPMVILVYFMVICYIFPVLGVLYHEKYGNPGGNYDSDMKSIWLKLAAWIQFWCRVARFFLVQNTKTWKIYQITTNYICIPNVHKI